MWSCALRNFFFQSFLRPSFVQALIRQIQGQELAKTKPNIKISGVAALQFFKESSPQFPRLRSGLDRLFYRYLTLFVALQVSSIRIRSQAEILWQSIWLLRSLLSGISRTQRSGDTRKPVSKIRFFPPIIRVTDGSSRRYCNMPPCLRLQKGAIVSFHSQNVR